MGIYERCDVTMAVDLFDWTYRRSQARYKVVMYAMGSPGPFRVKYREALSVAVGRVVRDRQGVGPALASLGLPDADASRFRQLLEQELSALAAFNCARYRLGVKQAQAWIDEGHPR
jgi:hypothetical protein